MKYDKFKEYIYVIGRYASEGIKAACDWAYKGVKEDSVLEGKFNINL